MSKPQALDDLETRTAMFIAQQRNKILKDLKTKYSLTVEEVEKHLHLLAPTEQIVLRLRFDIRFPEPMPLTQFPGYAEALAAYKKAEMHYITHGGDPDDLPRADALAYADSIRRTHECFQPDTRRRCKRIRISQPDPSLLLRINLANAYYLQPRTMPYGREFQVCDRIQHSVGLSRARCDQILKAALTKIARKLDREVKS